jgi:hypothetical protein
MREMIEEMVDEIFDIEGPVRIGGLTFNRSDIVREMDPVAYREAMNDMADSMITDLQDELESLDPEVDAEEIGDIQDRINALENI